MAMAEYALPEEARVDVELVCTATMAACWALGQHDQWCGHNPKAPGSPAFNEADAALEGAGAATRRLLAALPQPEWEPSDEMVSRVMAGMSYSYRDENGAAMYVASVRTSPAEAAAYLKALHRAGFDLSLSNQEGTS